MTTHMRWALISGDGLPVSGLLTIFRNVVGQARDQNLLTLPVTADLGYSWRPDKPGFFPFGPSGDPYPDWLDVSSVTPLTEPKDHLAAEFAAIRRAVAHPGDLTATARDHLRQRIDALAAPYEEYFTEWFAAGDVDWVVAVNMTLSDAVPVTTALHRAAARRWRDRPGGVVYWDHDLFGTCAVHEDGRRVYPATPNEFTLVPGTNPADRWAVVSSALEEETRSYPTRLRPHVVTNVLPSIPDGPLTSRHHDFLHAYGLAADRPVVLAPVRVFEVKGVEVSIEVLGGMRDACTQAGTPEPVLLVFGSLSEDPDYADTVRRAAKDNGVEASVVFLDGVPLSSHRDQTGAWRLDEIDLLRIARETHGAVLFTPNRPDVESVGLGPALAAVAGIPCAVTDYDAFDEHFGAAFSRVRVDRSAPERAGRQLVEWMTGLREHAASARNRLTANLADVGHRFPTGPWTEFLTELAGQLDERPRPSRVTTQRRGSGRRGDYRIVPFTRPTRP
jgi:hypothetical protein